MMIQFVVSDRINCLCINILPSTFCVIRYAIIPKHTKVHEDQKLSKAIKGTKSKLNITESDLQKKKSIFRNYKFRATSMSNFRSPVKK